MARPWSKGKGMKLSGVIRWPAIWLVANSLLLLFAANCSLRKQNVDKPARLSSPKSAEKEAVSGRAEKKVANSRVDEPADDNLVADNSFCHVCHLNYDGEEITVDHERAGIGCAKCHGRSHDHCGDENNITPPEIMYPAARIDFFCMSCHPRTEISQQDVHEPLLSGVAAQQSYCTDCHGREHRLSVRSVRWDKATGELSQQ